MPSDPAALAWAFGWGLVAGSGMVAGALLALVADLPHRAVAATMSLGAGLVLAAASVELAAESLRAAGAGVTAVGIVGGAAGFSLANAALVMARDRKRCGECKAQPSEAEAPGSGLSIALGTALDAVPEALVLGVVLRSGGPDLALVAAFALGNLPEGLSGSAGMRRAGRSRLYVLGLWGGIALGAALATALALYLLGGVGPAWIALLRAFSAGALIALAAETMIPEAFHDAPRYSGVLAALGFAALLVVGIATN